MQTDTADPINSRNKQNLVKYKQIGRSRKFQETKGEKNALQSKMQTDTADSAN